MTFRNVSFRENETDINSTIYSTEPAINITNEENVLYPITLVIPITVIYGIIFFTGLVGNVSTCIVISRNKSMHTATNYYLFSLAISDLLLLVSGLPPEMYRIWSPETYVFGEAFCILQGFAAETSANATVLTITAFTVERYLAICHPFLSHTMSKLSRAVKYVIAIWITALCLAAPQAMQFGVEYDLRDGFQRSRCTVVSTQFYFQHAFEISTFVFFVGPMTLITVLYVLIALKLRNSKLLSMQKRTSSLNNGNDETCTPRTSRSTAAQKRVIKMLVAVVVAFFICWAPFHAQRLLAVYLSSASPQDQETFIRLYIVLMYTSGVLYFLSTTVNPVLYHIMSKKFREAFKATFSQLCHPNSSRRYDRKMYSSLLRHPQSFRSFRATSNAAEHIQPRDISCFSKEFPSENENNTTPIFKPTSNQSTTKETALSRINPGNGNFRPRMASETSQTTVLTTLSKSLSTDPKNENRIHPPLGRSVSTVHRQVLKSRHQGRNYLNRHKHGILSYGMFKLFNRQNAQNRSYFTRQGSLESAHSTNTISNSSLQDMDESEFNSSELAQYMEEVNNELA